MNSIVQRFAMRLVALSLTLAGASIAALPGFRTNGRFLTAPTGDTIVLKGVNAEVVWLYKSGITSGGVNVFNEIAKTKANCVRIVWALGSGTAAELDIAIQNCVKAGLIPIPELHDATGVWSSLSTVVNGWAGADYVKVIQKHERYLIVNIGNEVGNTVADADFQSGYISAVQKLRRAGIRVPLLIDADGYGQNYSAISNTGPKIIASDSLKNVIFSVHMYWPLKYYNNSKSTVVAKIKSSMDDAVSKNIPLIVGEFGEAFTDKGVVGPNDSIPFRDILAQGNSHKIGYLPWSWRGNNPQTDLDMTTNDTYASLQKWGLQAMVTDPNSVQNTSVPARYITDNVKAGNFPGNGNNTGISQTGAAKAMPAFRVRALGAGWLHFEGLEGSGNTLVLRDLRGIEVASKAFFWSTGNWRPGIPTGSYELLLVGRGNSSVQQVIILP